MHQLPTGMNNNNNNNKKKHPQNWLDKQMDSKSKTQTEL